MKQNWLLSPDRQLTEDERTLIWKKPASHVESAAERRICRAVKRNWNRGEMKISTILLEGDAGSGKTQLAKALSADFGLPYTKVTCFADMDKLCGPMRTERLYATNYQRMKKRVWRNKSSPFVSV